MAFVTFADFRLQRIEQNNPAGGDAHMNDAAIIGRPFAIDQIPLGQFIDEAGDIRGARYETGSQVKRGHLFGSGGAEKAQGVVLLGRKTMPVEQLIFKQP